MAKSFIVKNIIIALVFLLAAGIITADENTSRSLTGKRTKTVSYSDVQNFISENFLSRK